MTDRLDVSGVRHLVSDPSDLLGALRLASRHSDHIARMMTRRGDVLDTLAGGPEVPMAAALAQMRLAGEGKVVGDAMRDMRRAKEAAQLVIAAADLSGAWTSDRVTQELTTLADLAVQTSLRLSVREGWAQ